MGKPKEGTQRVNLFLDPKIVEKAKIQAIKEKISLSELTDKALEAYCATKNYK